MICPPPLGSRVEGMFHVERLPLPVQHGSRRASWRPDGCAMLSWAAAERPGAQSNRAEIGRRWPGPIVVLADDRRRSRSSGPAPSVVGSRGTLASARRRVGIHRFPTENTQVMFHVKHAPWSQHFADLADLDLIIRAVSGSQISHKETHRGRRSCDRGCYAASAATVACPAATL